MKYLITTIVFRWFGTFWIKDAKEKGNIPEKGRSCIKGEKFFEFLKIFKSSILFVGKKLNLGTKYARNSGKGVIMSPF